MSRFFGKSKKSSTTPEVQVPQTTPGPEPEDDVFTFLPETSQPKEDISSLYPSLTGMNKFLFDICQKTYLTCTGVNFINNERRRLYSQLEVQQVAPPT